MLRGEAPTAEEARAFEIAMILHAEHELNASTFAARVVAGTNADMHSAIVAAICALKGPLHGGANQAAMAMFAEFGSVAGVADGIRARLEAKRPLYGFDHPLYRAMDPRAPILRRLSESFADDGEPNFLELAAAAEHEAHEQKGLWPNVDLYSGVALPLSGHPDRPLHPALRDEPRGRPGGARARAARGREDHPAELRVRGRTAAPLPRAAAPLRYRPSR